MQKHMTRSSALKAALGTGALVALAALAIKVSALTSKEKLAAPAIDPALDYETAMARLAQVQAQEDDRTLNLVCHSKALTHGRKVERAIVLMHGMTNCPQQYVELAPLFYERGYNVLIPRMPRNGRADEDTDALKYLTASELQDCCTSMVDIARGLGEHVTYAGISAGGTMAAWAVQHRADVDKVVLIAPAFTISRGLGVGISRFAMYLFLLMPNIMTQHFRPFTGGLDHNYRGFATRGLGEMMYLGFSVYDAAKTTKPAARSALVITNAADPAVGNGITRKLVDRWRAKGLEYVETYEFDAKYQLIHDVIDPQQQGQQTALVYPILLDLIM
jgi:pimeloyl-ACP methyl ester carboxylesterase